MTLDPAWIALIGTLCGGIGLKVLEHWLGKSKVKIDDAARIRDELRIEITTQRTEIRELEALVDKWRTQYYALREEFIAEKTKYTLELDALKRELVEAQRRLDLLPPK